MKYTGGSLIYDMRGRPARHRVCDPCWEGGGAFYCKRGRRGTEEKRRMGGADKGERRKFVFMSYEIRCQGARDMTAAERGISHPYAASGLTYDESDHILLADIYILWL